MAKVHDDIEAHGAGSRELPEQHDKVVLRAAENYMRHLTKVAEGASDTVAGFLFSGWCQAALPHKKLADGEGWQISGEHVTLIVQPGMRPGAGNKPVLGGVPYGSRARLIMLYLQTQAKKTRSREIVLGHSMRDWLGRMGIAAGGKSVTLVREQADRISRCNLTFHVKMGKATGLKNQLIVEEAIFLDNKDMQQGSLFNDTAKLSEGFFNQLMDHAVPLDEAAIREISNNSMALDIYAWLAYRLHVLDKPVSISWVALKAQFGNGFSLLNNFRAKFVTSLTLATSVYPGARVEVSRQGLVLHPSRSPVDASTRVMMLGTKSAG